MGSFMRPSLRPGTIVVFIVVLFITAFSQFGAAQGTTQIGLSPLAIELAGQRGETVPFAIDIVNNSLLQSARFKVRVVGLDESQDGGYLPLFPDEGPYAASEWVQMERDSFEIPPGGVYELRGVVTIPRNAPASGYAAVLMELQPEERRGTPALSIEYEQQFLTALEIIVGNRHVRSAHIDSMAVIPSRSVPELQAMYGDDAVMFIGSVLNDGDVHVTGEGILIIRDERGRRVREVPLGGGRGVVLPEAVVDYRSVLRGLTPGRYEMQTIVNYGGSRPAIGRMEFELTDDALGVSQIFAGRAVRIDAGPSLLHYEFPRLGYRAQTITVVNRDDVDVDVNVTLEELVYDEGGEVVAVDPGVVMPYSAVAWGEVRPAQFTLRPGQRRNVVVGFRAPEDETGGRYARVRIEGKSGAIDDETPSTATEIMADALLMLGTDLAPLIQLAEVDWQPMGGVIAAGAMVANNGDIHGPAGLRITLLEYSPEIEEEEDGFIVFLAGRWDVVDTATIGPESVLLPGDQRFLYGMFDQQVLQTDRQYQIVVEALGADGVRTDQQVMDFWIDADGFIYDGMPEEPQGGGE